MKIISYRLDIVGPNETKTDLLFLELAEISPTLFPGFYGQHSSKISELVNLLGNISIRQQTGQQSTAQREKEALSRSDD